MNELNNVLLGNSTPKLSRREVLTLMGSAALVGLTGCVNTRVPFKVNGDKNNERKIIERGMLPEEITLEEQIVDAFSGLDNDPNSKFAKISSRENPQYKIHSSPLVRSGKITDSTAMEISERFFKVWGLAKISSKVAQDVSRQNAASLRVMGFNSADEVSKRLEDNPESFNYSSGFGGDLDRLLTSCEEGESILSNMFETSKGLSHEVIRSDKIMNDYLTEALALAELSKSNLKGINMALRISAGSNKSEGLFSQGYRMSVAARDINEVLIGERGFNNEEGEQLVYDAFGKSNFKEELERISNIMNSSRSSVVKNDVILRGFRYNVLESVRKNSKPWVDEQSYQNFVAAKNHVDNSIDSVYSRSGRRNFNALNLIVPLTAARDLVEGATQLGFYENIHDSVKGNINDAVMSALNFENGYNNGDHRVGDGNKMKWGMARGALVLGITAATIYFALGSGSSSSSGKVYGGGLTSGGPQGSGGSGGLGSGGLQGGL